MLERNRFGGFRGLVLILVGIFMGATLITPAVAHVGGTITHLWGAPGHIKAKVKAYGDNRWLGKAAKAVDAAHADSADLATSAETASFADEADSASTAESAGFADEAGNADTLDGRNSTDFDDAQTLDGVDSAGFATKLWAVVNGSNGTLVRGNRATTSTRSGTGTYQVRFDQNIRNCAYVAQVGDVDASGIESPGFITTVGEGASVNGVWINTYNAAGTAADRSFHLWVIC
ncbi:MAG: hypothetical protein ACRDIX_05335 [Actinomycetota bacterium]